MARKKCLYTQLKLWDFMEKDLSNADQEVPIKNVVNLKTTPISHYEVSLAYGDLTLIIAMLRDYVKGFDAMIEDGTLAINQYQYEAYYRNKFLKIADKISTQIEYDYDKKLEKCLKKSGKEDDIGQEALILALKKDARKAEQKQAKQEASA